MKHSFSIFTLKPFKFYPSSYRIVRPYCTSVQGGIIAKDLFTAHIRSLLGGNKEVCSCNLACKILVRETNCKHLVKVTRTSLYFCSYAGES